MSDAGGTEMTVTPRTPASGTPPTLEGGAPGDRPPVADRPSAQARGAAGPSAKPKAPERPAAAIRADIERERAALQGSFETLRGELDEAVDAARQRAVDAGRKARVVGPVVAGAVASVAGAVLLLRRRRGRRR